MTSARRTGAADVEFAVVNSSKHLADRDVEFMVAACQAQAVEFCRAWMLDPPAAALYRSLDGLPADDIYVVGIVDDLDEPGALGYHADVGDRPCIRVLAQGPQTSVTLSHEFLELLFDPTCDRWVPKGDGTEIAAEVCDPVEGDSYPVLAEVAGEGRTVELSDYVLPPYFDRTQQGPTSRTGLPLEPFGIRAGGYQVVLGRDGKETDVFARLAFAHEDARGKLAAAGKLMRADSRVMRRLKGRP